ncbi:MAG: hypothetical protein AB8C02_09875 [Halioglobus sp.]
MSMILKAASMLLTAFTALQRCISLAAITACLVGCTQWQWNLGEPVAPFSAGSSAQGMPLGAVLEVLGPPQHISATSNGYLMAWEYWQITENSAGISLGILGAEFLNFDWGKMRTQGEYLLVSFDDAHEVATANRATWNGEAGSGMAVQPLASVLSVVDSDDLRSAMPQHGWGLSLLQRLPSGLNRQSNMEESHNGLQRRGTTGALGQHSLDTNR